jgi:hypothetical protein
MENQKEIWKTIDGYENYQVSNLGNVKNLKTNKILKKGNSRGYVCQVLSKNNIHKTFKNHRLVAQAFINNNQNKLFVNHINGIKTDNRVENLQWCTAKENTIHAIENNLIVFGSGENSRCVKLKEIQVLEIRELNKKYSQNYLSKIYNVSRGCISSIIYRKSWNHI